MQVWFGMTGFPMIKHLNIDREYIWFGFGLRSLTMHYLSLSTDGITDEQIRPSIVIDDKET